MHRDPPSSWTCHRLLVHWDRVVDQLLCSGLVAAVVTVVWALITILTSANRPTLNADT